MLPPETSTVPSKVLYIPFTYDRLELIVPSVNFNVPELVTIFRIEPLIPSTF